MCVLCVCLCVFVEYVKQHVEYRLTSKKIDDRTNPN